MAPEVRVVTAAEWLGAALLTVFLLLIWVGQRISDRINLKDQP